MPDFSMEALKARRPWIHVLQVLRVQGCQPRLLYSAKLSITVDVGNKICNDKVRFSQYVSTNPALQKALEGKLHSKKVYYAQRLRQQIIPLHHKPRVKKDK